MVKMELDTIGRVCVAVVAAVVVCPARHTSFPLPCTCNRFVVLVSGTIIYSKGDEKDVQDIAAEEIAGVPTPTHVSETRRLPVGGVAIPGTVTAAPVHISGSLAGKATMNINQFSSSLRHSYAGSLRTGSFVPAGAEQSQTTAHGDGV